MKRRAFDALVVALPLALSVRTTGAQASAPEVAAELPGARLQGEARLRFLGLSVYDARLWVQQRSVGADDWATVPLALEIRYLRSLDGAKIAERSLDEMRRQGDIAPDAGARWLEQMKRLLPDVKDGDRVTGLLLPGAKARFFFNGTARGEIDDPAFAKMFFGIWLAPQTSEPAMRRHLLGAPRP